MSKTNITPKQELEIVKDYTENRLGIYPICEKYSIGKIKVKSILKKYEIPLNHKGKQPLNLELKVTDFKIKKYINTNEYTYIVYDEKTAFESKDIDNNGGILTSYLNKEYGIEIPTLYDRRMYYMKTGNYWWEQWLKVKQVKRPITKKCPYCGWKTNDLENKSGAFERHLLKIHNKTKIDYLYEYPEDKDYFILVNKSLNRQMETDNNKFTICKICGKKLARIDTHHLKTHNITKQQYIEKYGYNNLTSNEYHEMQSKQTIETNKNMKFVKTSTEENEIINMLRLYGINASSNRTILNGKEIDIYIPEKRIGIEFNGVLWHSEKYGKDKYYHLNKTMECETQGVRLIQIFEDEYQYHKDIVLSKIRQIFGLNYYLPKIHGRLVSIQKINYEDTFNFLNSNHIQGAVRSTVYLGAYYKDTLIAVMTFKKETNDNWELTRYATDINFRCIGVASKLFSFFIKNYKYNIIKSFADRRWTSTIYSSLYDKLGFKISQITSPDYKYHNSKIDRFKRFHKFGFRKQILVKKYGLDPNLTELEMTRLLGYDRIWDCGLIKYIYTNPDYIFKNSINIME